MRKFYNRLSAFILIALFLFTVAPLDISATDLPPQENMEVHFIDVGQGDSTLITCGNQAMLIDAGDDTKGTAIQSYLQKRGIEKLDYLVLTHPDADHIGGAPVIITKFDIDTVFVSNYKKDTMAYQKLIQALDNKMLTCLMPTAGAKYSLGSAEITILSSGKEYNESNNASVSLVIQNGDNRFLFTGDAEELAETDMLATDISVKADVYQVGHHGSKTASSAAFMEAVNPQYAVISCAEGNSYGYPHAQTLNTFRTKGIKVYRTDEAGSIIAVSDGKNISFSVPESDSWQAGEPTVASENAATKETAETIEQKTQVQSTDENTLTYVLNVKTKKFHKTSCGSLPTTNRLDSTKSRSEIIESGYVPCKKCNP